MPHRLGGLAAVVRIGLGDRLAPAFVRVPRLALDADQHEGAIVRTAEARFEEMHQRQAAEEQLDLLDLHAYKLYSAAEWPFTISPSKARSGLARRGWPNGWRHKLEATTILEDTENPFLADFYADRPGSALQAQLFYLLNRHRQLTGKRQADLFLQTTICDYVFDKDKIFAYLNLDDNELFIYQRLFDLLARDVPPPDLVVYLQAPTELLMERLRARSATRRSGARRAAAGRRVPARAERGLPALLLPLHRHAAAGRRNLGVRSRIGRCGARRARQADQGHGQGDALLRSAEVVGKLTVHSYQELVVS